MAYFTSSSGLEIYYETHGDSGPPLVMLHGLGSNSQVWQPQIEAFSRYFRLFLLDFPGHGQSDSMLIHTMSRYADVLAEFLNVQQLDRVYLMGLSLGCAVALIFGTEHPDRVRGYVLQGPVGGLTPPWLPWAWPKMLLLIAYLLTLMLLTLLLGKRRTVWLMNVIPVQTKAYNPLLDCVERQASPLAKVCLTLQSTYPPYIGNLSRITAPVLVLYGKRDPFPRRYYRYVVNHVAGPATLIEIPGGKHVIALDNPVAYNRACLDFLLALEQSDAKNPGG